MRDQFKEGSRRRRISRRAYAKAFSEEAFALFTPHKADVFERQQSIKSIARSQRICAISLIDDGKWLMAKNYWLIGYGKLAYSILLIADGE